MPNTSRAELETREVHVPFIRSAFNYNKEIVTDRTGLSCGEPSLTQQHFKDETDINVLLERFRITGQMPEGVKMPTYGDFEGVADYHTAANAIAEAHESFEMLPAQIRKRFSNDPAKFIDFCSNPDNRQEAERMGLVPTKTAVDEPKPVAQPEGELRAANHPTASETAAPAAPA